ncbi:MAG: hypothetical protein L0H53_00005, partial [Candidatus Nitrosocosmicus sp.]|nr:hypothetical protein [Candidatus Nitrosocosmicus sp.]
MNEFITLLQGIKHFPISDSEKRVLYNIINNRQRDSNEKIRKLKNFFGFKNNKKVESDSITSVEANSLMQKGILELDKLSLQAPINILHSSTVI